MDEKAPIVNNSFTGAPLQDKRNGLLAKADSPSPDGQ